MEFFLSQPHRVGGRHPLGGQAARRCGFEHLEPRQMLAADLAFGQTGSPTGGISGSVFTSTSAASCASHVATDNLAEVRVQLLDETGAVIDERSTDATGAYQFAELLPGQYAVRQVGQHGMLEGASHVGDGGGVAFDSNLVGEIVVQAGETLGGYDFCEFADSVEPAGPSDRPIVPHDDAVQALPLLALSLQTTSLQTTPLARPKLFAEPTLETAQSLALVQFVPLEVSRPTEVFGGSSRSLKEPEGIKAWDADPFDSLFSTASFLNLAGTELPTIDELMPELGESDEGSDALFADDNTVSAIELWADELPFEPNQLRGEAEVIDLDGEPAVPKIARLHVAN